VCGSYACIPTPPLAEHLDLDDAGKHMALQLSCSMAVTSVLLH